MKRERIEIIRGDYDLVAEEYARRLFRELEGKPLDQQLLHRLAAEVGGLGAVCDLGCGPGHVARFLSDAGTHVFGIDLSPEMVAQAQRLNPGISFREGNMLSLELPEGALAGIAAFYSIVNLPVELLPTAFSEMRRVLTPGGMLLLAFHTGDETLRPEEMWGRSISMEFYHFQPRAIERFLEDAGFVIEETVERGPYAPKVEYQSHRAYIFARKPEVLSAGSRTET
ncbi:MAG: class I SAM-dependent methyltransferase [Terracidiphilus sp.]